MGGSGYTSARAALRLLERGVAIAVGTGVIHLLDEQWLRTERAIERAAEGQRECDIEIRQRRRAGMVYWNGTGHPDGVATPGMRRS